MAFCFENCCSDISICIRTILKTEYFFKEIVENRPTVVLEVQEVCSKTAKIKIDWALRTYFLLIVPKSVRPKSALRANFPKFARKLSENCP